MTEGEWRSCNDPEVMLRFIRARVSDRTLRQFAIACCERIVDRFDSKRNRLLLALAMEYLDVPANTEQNSAELACMATCHDDADYAAFEASVCSAHAIRDIANVDADREPAFQAERVAQAKLLRDLVAFPV